jgi:hypothetical protein
MGLPTPVTAPPLSSLAPPILHVDSAAVEATLAALEIENHAQIPLPYESSSRSSNTGKSDRRLFGMLLPIRRRHGHRPNSSTASPLNTNDIDQNQHQLQQQTIYDSNMSESQAAYFGGRMETDGIMKSSSLPKQRQQQQQHGQHAQQNHPQHWFGGTNEPIIREHSLQISPVDAKSLSKMNTSSGWWPQPLAPITTTTAAPAAAAMDLVRSHSFPQTSAAVDAALSQRIYKDGDDEEEEQDGVDSLRDFDASEWTPPDSSYGAAIPVAGWIPKSWRRSMEWTVLAAVAAIVVILIVRTSLRANDNNNSGGGSNSKRYHYNTNNDVVATVTDDLAVGTETAAADSVEWNDDYYNVNHARDGGDEVVDDDQQNDSDDAVPADDAENAENGANRPLWLFL